MLTLEQIQAKLAELKADPRHAAKPANVFVNAPLALIQCQIQGQVQSLEWVLGQREGL